MVVNECCPSYLTSKVKYLLVLLLRPCLRFEHWQRGEVLLEIKWPQRYPSICTMRMEDTHAIGRSWKCPILGGYVYPGIIHSMAEYTIFCPLHIPCALIQDEGMEGWVDAWIKFWMIGFSSEKSPSWQFYLALAVINTIYNFFQALFNTYNTDARIPTCNLKI